MIPRDVIGQTYESVALCCPSPLGVPGRCEPARVPGPLSNGFNRLPTPAAGRASPVAKDDKSSARVCLQHAGNTAATRASRPNRVPPVLASHENSKGSSGEKRFRSTHITSIFPCDRGRREVGPSALRKPWQIVLTRFFLLGNPSPIVWGRVFVPRNPSAILCPRFSPWETLAELFLQGFSSCLGRLDRLETLGTFLPQGFLLGKPSRNCFRKGFLPGKPPAIFCGRFSSPLARASCVSVRLS